MNILYNNFSSGLVSKKMAGRWDTQAYATGMEEAENVKVLYQGGVTRRWATKNVASTVHSRLIPFTINVNKSYIIELFAYGISIWDTTTLTRESFIIDNVSTNVFNTDYTDSELFEIQYTQDYECLYLVHKQHRPMMLWYTGASFQFGSMDFTFITPTEDEDSGLFTTPNKYPSVVSYISNRLWLGATNHQPYTLWASRPFEKTNFERKDNVQVVDDVLTMAGIKEAVINGTDIDLVPTRYKIEKVIRADNAMKLQVGSDRSERIEWVTGGNNIIVGTASSEWVMSGAIDALNQKIMQVSSYGSSSFKPEKAGTDVLFIQSGKRKLMSLTSSNDGFGVNDLTSVCDGILDSGVKQMAWMRVPEPTLFCVLNNGNLAVLSYSQPHQINAWTLWTFGAEENGILHEGKVQSVCVTDSPNGQEVWINIKRRTVEGDTIGNWEYFIEQFRQVDCESLDLKNNQYVYRDRYEIVDGEVVNEGIPFVSRIVTNRYETTLDGKGSTVGIHKRATEVTLRMLNSTGYVAKMVGNDLSATGEDITLGDAHVFLSGAYDETVQVEVKSLGDKPFTVLASSINMEIAR